MPIAALALANAAGGCTGGVRFCDDYQRLSAGIRRVRVMTPDVAVFSLHAGGALEPRADLAGEVRGRLADELKSWLSGRSVAVVPNRGEAGPEPINPLIDAVRESILTHHFANGPRPPFDYTIGRGGAVSGSSSSSAARISESGDEADAVLYTSLNAAVPTGGRRAFAATALAVGALAQSLIRIETHRAMMDMMLVDARSGRVLWFSLSGGEADVSSTGGLRGLVHGVGRSMLEKRRE